MKRTFLLCIVSFYFNHLAAQIFVEGKPLSEIFQGKYITVCPDREEISKYLACIDYGQETIRRPGRNQAVISDEKGEDKIFNSKTGIMNFLYENGFDVFHLSDSTTCIIYYRKE